LMSPWRTRRLAPSVAPLPPKSRCYPRAPGISFPPLPSACSTPFFSSVPTCVVFSLHFCFPFAPQKHWAITIIMKLYRKREKHQ